VQSHDYIAMERLYEVHSSGRFDLIVVDTPPTRNAIDFLEAPGRMADFFSSRLLKWLTAPARNRVLNLATRPFYQIADRILGSAFLEDIAEFFLLFQTMYDGFVARAEAVTRLLHDRRTTFVVVSTLEPAPLREAEFFLDALRDRDFALGAVVLNKVLPASLRDTRAASVAKSMAADPAQVLTESVRRAAHLDGASDVAAAQRVVQAVGENYLRFAIAASREAEARAALRSTGAIISAVPYSQREVVDVGALLELGAQMWNSPK